MRTLSRRGFLKRSAGTAATAAVGAAACTAIGTGSALASSPPELEDLEQRAADTKALLYDSTLCIGCRGCELACNEKYQLGRTDDEIFEGRPAEDARALGTTVYTYVTFHQVEADPSTAAFGKVQCMHCIEPACASSCPVSALEKTELGPVIYHADLCLGCRYCMMACPFLVPRFEWDHLNPRIRKCDMCYDLQLDGESPACVANCPTGALLWGTRSELLDAAYQRFLDNPRGYLHHVYGENEAGGTNFLHIAAREFDELGYRRNLPMRSYREYTKPAMHAIPWVFNGLGIVLGVAAWMNMRGAEEEEEVEVESTASGTSEQEGVRR